VQAGGDRLFLHTVQLLLAMLHSTQLDHRVDSQMLIGSCIYPVAYASPIRSNRCPRLASQAVSSLTSLAGLTA
jgi:hypothetical protein